MNIVIQIDDWVEVNDKQFYFHPDKKTFQDANEYCTKNQAKLFEPKNRKDNEDVSSTAESQGISEFWIGISYDTEKEFVYQSDNEKLPKVQIRKYDTEKTSWSIHQPDCSNDNGKCDDYCVERGNEDSDTWDDLPCDNKRAFVCERRK